MRLSQVFLPHRLARLHKIFASMVRSLHPAYADRRAEDRIQRPVKAGRLFVLGLGLSGCARTCYVIELEGVLGRLRIVGRLWRGAVVYARARYSASAFLCPSWCLGLGDKQ